jgi:hypothetical protein
MPRTVTTEPKSNGQFAKLQRTTFRTSRLLDFCGQKQLTAQTGHDPVDWPLVAEKELLDNALDACEESGVAPAIDVKVDGGGITVADNGPGIPATTVASILDYSTRTSSREAYVSPTRGAQGNALSTVFAMPFALDGAAGRVDVSAHGQRHEITFGVDPIRQEPDLAHTTHKSENVKNGTAVKVWWPDSACSILTDAKDRFLQLADDYTFLNPHLTLTVDWRGDQCTAPRRLVTGVNFSPGIGNPFRTLGNAYGDGLAALLEKRFAGPNEPIVFLLHLAHPRVRYTDRGKSALVIK